MMREGDGRRWKAVEDATCLEMAWAMGTPTGTMRIDSRSRSLESQCRVLLTRAMYHANSVTMAASHPPASIISS